MSRQHKHAEVLRAIADGVPLSEFEISDSKEKKWSSFTSNNWSAWIYWPDEWEIRRKPQYIMVNGFKVPKPLDSAESVSKVYTPSVMNKIMCVTWFKADNIALAIGRGVAHSTKEAAIAHAKAMLGIDPEWSE